MQPDGDDLTKLSVSEIKKRFFWAGATLPTGCVEKSELVAALKKVLANSPPKAKAGTTTPGQNQVKSVPQTSQPKINSQPKSTADLVAALQKSVGLVGPPAPKSGTPPKFVGNVDMPGMFKKASASSVVVPSAAQCSSPPANTVAAFGGLEKTGGMTVPPPVKAGGSSQPKLIVSAPPETSGRFDFDPPMTEIISASSGPPVREEVLKKSGKELFRELLRIYSTAIVDDYFKDGVWKDGLMRDDYVLLEAHRKAACAISPPDLEDVIVPEPGATNGIVAPWAIGMAPITTEYEFMLKWRLDPARTKVALGNLSQQRRNYVFQRFKAASVAMDTNIQLGNFVQSCQMSAAWDKVGAVAPPVAQMTPTSKSVPKMAQGFVVPPKSAGNTFSQLAESSPSVARARSEIATPIASTIGSVSSAKRPPAPPNDPDLDPSKRLRTTVENPSSTMLQPSMALKLAAALSNGPVASKASRVARPPILGKRCNPASKAQTP